MSRINIGDLVEFTDNRCDWKGSLGIVLSKEYKCDYWNYTVYWIISNGALPAGYTDCWNLGKHLKKYGNV
jgi:hypothetical protein